jgi:WD40 repeat protein
LILLISSSKNGKILIFDVTDEEITLHQHLDQEGDIRCLNLYSQGLISSIHHGKAFKWNFCDRLKIFKFDKSSKFDFCCFDLDKSFSISEDGKYLFGMNDNHKTRILVENIETKDEQFELKGHFDIITAILFDSENFKLYSAGKDKSIIKWDLEDLKNTDTLTEKCKEEDRIDNVHEADIFTLEPIFDFKFLVSGGKDKQIKLLETSSMSIISCIETGHSVYGIRVFMTKAMYFGKNSRNIGKWDLKKYIDEGKSEKSEQEEDFCESPKQIIKKDKTKAHKNTKSCVLGSGDIKVDKFFNKSNSLTQSKTIIPRTKDQKRTDKYYKLPKTE